MHTSHVNVKKEVMTVQYIVTHTGTEQWKMAIHYQTTDYLYPSKTAAC